MKRIIHIFCCLILLMVPTYSSVDLKVGSVILDDEIEEILTSWIQQIFKVAGLKNYKVRVYLVVDPEINAQATVGGQIIVNTGLLLKSQNAAQVLGVLAHEVGHITGGHIARFDQATQGAMIPAAAAILLGGAAAIATGDASVAMAGLDMAGHTFGRSMLKFTRTQESAADQAAISYLDRLGWGCQGLLDFFKIIHEKTRAIASQFSPYELSHPLTEERMKALEVFLQNSNKTYHVPESIETQYQRLKAKVYGFLEPAKTVLQRLANPKTNPPLEGKVAIQYAKAIALFRDNHPTQAIQELDTLLNSYPNDGYFTELKGQILLDSGKIPEAIQNLEKANTQRPKAQYIKVMLAHAHIERGQAGDLKKAISLLTPVTQKHSDNIFAWHLLAIAHGKDNEPGLAALALAEESYLKQDLGFAHRQAEKAVKLLEKNPKAAMRAKDLLRDIAHAKH